VNELHRTDPKQETTWRVGGAVTKNLAIRPSTLRLAIAVFVAVLVMLGLRSPAPAQADPFFGIISQRHMEASDFSRMEQGNLGSFRMPIDWAHVQSRRDGQMNWGIFDEMVEMTAQLGISFLPTLYNSPRWVNLDHRRLPVDDADAIRAWKNFIREAVMRYGRDGKFWAENPEVPYRPVMKWQVWNEANIHFFAKPVSPRLYGKLLKISASEVRRVDPRGKVVMAGLFGRPKPGTGITAWRYLRRLYRIPGVRNSFDVAAIHPYARNTRQSIGRINMMRRVLNGHRNRGKRLMITEIGWGSDSDTAFGRGDNQGQAAQLRNIYRALIKNRKRLKLQSVYWFSWSDLGPREYRCNFCQNTGLIDYTGRPKAAWHRMLDFSRPG